MSFLSNFFAALCHFFGMHGKINFYFLILSYLFESYNSKIYFWLSLNVANCIHFCQIKWFLKTRLLLPGVDSSHADVVVALSAATAAAEQAGKASATFNADINVLGHHKGSSVDGIDADVVVTVAATSTATKDAGVAAAALDADVNVLGERAGDGECRQQ